MASEERGMVSGSGDDQQKEILPMEASRERVESLWRQVLNQRSTGRPDLSAAKASRAKAELERQRISQEALEATQEACQDLIEQAEGQLMKAKQAELEADHRLKEAAGQLETTKATRAEADTYRSKTMAEADSYRDKILSDAHAEAPKVRDDERAATVRECDELKRHVTYEVQSILPEVDAIREAAQEELEAQRIYSKAANLKVSSQNVRSDVLGQVTRALSQEVENIRTSTDSVQPSAESGDNSVTEATAQAAEEDGDSGTARSKGSRPKK